MLPADMGGAADVRRGLMALSAFKKRVDTLLSAFEESAGGASKVERNRLSEAAFGTGNFPEAKALHLEYERVHERITALSKQLGLHMEAMRIAVHGVDVTFDNLEDEQRLRFHEIRAEIERTRHESDKEDIGRDNRADRTDAGY